MKLRSKVLTGNSGCRGPHTTIQGCFRKQQRAATLFRVNWLVWTAPYLLLAEVVRDRVLVGVDCPGLRVARREESMGCSAEMQRLLTYKLI